MLTFLTKPANYYTISEQRGLRLEPSAETVRYYMLLALGFVIFNLTVIWISMVVWPPVTTAQYAAWMLIGLVSLISALSFFMLLFTSTHTFDRETDRFLRRQKLVSRISEIHHLRLYQAQIDGKPMCCLSVIFATRQPYVLGRQRLPGEELKAVANRVASYLRLTVVNEIA
jgi:hypothetical protein